MASLVYQKTELGRQAFKERSAGLTPKHRSAFILFDGSRNLVEVLAATSGLGVTQEDLELMVQRGFLALVPNSVATSGAQRTSAGMPTARTPVAADALQRSAALVQPLQSGSVVAGSGMTESQERYQSAYPIAAALTSSLGLRGFRLNLAVEAAGDIEQLRALLPKIREAVGSEKCRALEFVLGG